MPDNITHQPIYVVTSKTGDETYLIEAYTNEAAAIEHVNNAIKWFTQWTLRTIQAFANHYDIWPENLNPYDNVTPNIINDSIIYSWQRVNLKN